MPTIIDRRSPAHADPIPSTTTPLPSPAELAASFPVSERDAESVRAGRSEIRDILHRRDDRLLVIVGPCSIHDADAALDYARRLATLQRRVNDRLCLVMRVYLEKPRTTIGWRGLVSDPHLDGTCDMAEGLRRARRLLLDITGLGLPIATEALDPLTPAYLGDLVSFTAIGARTTESQPHRALASGLGMPVGFKNGTEGSLTVATDALRAARQSHSYFGLDNAGRAVIVTTTGNSDAVVILRGGKASGPNYEPPAIARAMEEMRAMPPDLPTTLLVDCSHANSGYEAARQVDVCRAVVQQRRSGTAPSVVGVMLESNIADGKQPLTPDTAAGLRYGVSVTDACLGWEATESLVREMTA